jgi:hypothetical protein
MKAPATVDEFYQGIPALQFQRDAGLGSYETAWTLVHKVRSTLVAPHGLFPLDGYVEVEETYVGWCAPGFSEAGYWTHAAIDDPFRDSYSTGVSMPSAECLRWRLWKISRYSKIAFVSSKRVLQRLRSRSSTCMRLQNDSIMALS